MAWQVNSPKTGNGNNQLLFQFILISHLDRKQECIVISFDIGIKPSTWQFYFYILLNFSNSLIFPEIWMRQDKVEENVCYPIMSKMKKNLYEEVFVPALVATVNSILSLHREYVLICVFTTSNSIIGFI